jgi:hypothetical protein
VPASGSAADLAASGGGTSERGAPDDYFAPAADQRGKESLLLLAAKQRAEKPPESEVEKLRNEEADIMKHITTKAALKSAKELAKVGEEGWDLEVGCNFYGFGC